MKLYQITDKEFGKYGRVLDFDAAELIERAASIEMPQSGSRYEASVAQLEQCDSFKTLKDEIFGELDIEVGCCWGHSDGLNAMEWHKSSEINIAVTDMILFLGTISKMEGERYSSENVKAFLMKKGTAIEVYATTLHFCPCETEKSGFMSVVVLPKGTNLPLDNAPEDKLLFRKNKWLIAHEDNLELIEKGVIPGIYGTNWKVGRDV